MRIDNARFDCRVFAVIFNSPYLIQSVYHPRCCFDSLVCIPTITRPPKLYIVMILINIFFKTSVCSPSYCVAWIRRVVICYTNNSIRMIMNTNVSFYYLYNWNVNFNYFNNALFVIRRYCCVEYVEKYACVNIKMNYHLEIILFKHCKTRNHPLYGEINRANNKSRPTSNNKVSTPANKKLSANDFWNI